MRLHHAFLVLCYAFILVNGAPKPSGEIVPDNNKDLDELDEGHGDIQTTLSPSDFAVDLPENWDQAKDDTQSLFLNKSDKNDLEPYPMALSDDAADGYDGQPIMAGDEKMEAKARSGILDHVLMRAEYYGEPPSMARQSRRKRAEKSSFRTALSSGNSKISKRGIRYSAMNRMKRETGMRSEDLLTLLSLWEAEQRRLKEGNPSNYYNPVSYYSQAVDPYEDNTDDSEDKWLDEPVVPSSRFSNYYDVSPSHYKYTQSYPDYVGDQSGYLQNLEEAVGRLHKRPWVGFANGKLAKRFMVAKKRSEPNQYYYSQKSYKPQEDLYTLSELLKSHSSRDQGLPIMRRMVL